ncbi:hypothetical protein GCM10010282_41120 [Streptomyces roseolus]|nr:hypothetical protein GCM10010282_41120 [Streptomyces roseolus]
MDRAAALYEGGAGGPVVPRPSGEEAQSSGTAPAAAARADRKNGYFIHTPCEIAPG